MPAYFSQVLLQCGDRDHRHRICLGFRGRAQFEGGHTLVRRFIRRA